MREVVNSLNEMSFELPEGWSRTRDIYDLPNGQGMINIQNYVSDKGEVISLFSVHRDPEEFFESYDRVVTNIDNITGKYTLLSCPAIKANGFVFPTYIIRGHGEKPLVTVQVFVNCGDCLGCFMVNIDSYNGKLTETIKSQHVLGELVKLLKTIE